MTDAAQPAQARAPAWPEHPAAGTCLHVTSLPGPHGIGSLGAAAHAFVDWLAATGLRVWQVLPLGPTGYGNSPYQALSTFAGNELLIDLDGLVADGLLDAADCAALEALPADHVDFAGVEAAKWPLLHQAATRLTDAAPDLRAARDAFVARHGTAWLDDYVLFRCLKSAHGEQTWTRWPTAQRGRDPAALEAASAAHAEHLERLRTIQFLFHRQWQALRSHAHRRGITLLGDLPIYIAHDSADAWARPDLLCLDASGEPTQVAGVPPDYFAVDGQRWGNPVYRWDAHAADGFAWWCARVAHGAAHCDLLRLDHFRGFEAYWSIPASAPTAREGSWQPGPGQALFDALRAALGELPLVAEDLGVITPEVEALRDAAGLPGMRVLQFEVDGPDFRLADLPAHGLCYTATHDNDTTRGWFATSPAQARVLANTGGSADSIHADLWRLALDSPSRLAIAPLQDLLGLDGSARMNTPGSNGPNWTWRLAPADADRLDGLTGTIAAALHASGRAGR